MSILPQTQLPPSPTPAEPWLDLEESPNIDHIETENDDPVDSIFSEKQQRLLTEPLHSSWDGGGHSFVAMANVGLFAAVHVPPLVPDALLSLDVSAPRNPFPKKHRSYFIWEYGKPPEVVIEIVSNRKGHELERKLIEYAQMGVNYYAVYDPEQHLGANVLYLYERRGIQFVEMSDAYFSGVGLGLMLWEGQYETMPGIWLRWCQRDQQLINTGAEQATLAEQRATEEQQRATAAEQRAVEQQQRATAAEQRTVEEQQRATAAEQHTVEERQRATKAEQRTAEERQRATAAEQRAVEEQQRATAAEQRAAKLEAQLKRLGINPDL